MQERGSQYKNFIVTRSSRLARFVLQEKVLSGRNCIVT